MSEALVNEFIKEYTLNTKIQVDESIINNLISNTLKLKKKHEDILTGIKNITNYQKELLEYNNLCCTIHLQAGRLAKLLLKNKRWSLRKNRNKHFDDGRKILHLIGKLMKDEIETQSTDWSTHDHGSQLEKLLQLTLLQDSPSCFLDNYNNQYIKIYSHELSNIKKKIRKLNKNDLKYNINNLKQLEQLKINLINHFDVNHINKQISNLKKSWARKLFGWATGQNKKLTDLIHIQTILPTINKQLSKIGAHIAASCNEEEILNNIKRFKIELLNNDISNDKIIEIKNFILKFLINKNQNIQQFSRDFLREIYLSLKSEIKLIAINPDQFIYKNTLRKKLVFFVFLPERKDHHLFQKYRSEIINEIKDQLDYYHSPENALEFLTTLNDLLEENCLPKEMACDIEINNFIHNKLDQFNAWDRIRKLKNNLLSDKLSIKDIDDFYLDTLSLISDQQIEIMRDEFEEMLNIIKYQILFNMNKMKSDPDNMKLSHFVKIRLHLFKLDKIYIPNNKNMVLLKKIRDNFVEKIIQEINSISCPLKLHQYTILLENIWPDKLFCKRLLVKNNNDYSILVKSGGILPKNLVFYQEEAMDYKVAINDISIGPQETRTIRIVPSLSEKNIIKTILEKRKKFINHHICSLHNNHQDKLDFLKSTDRSVLNKVWEKITGNHHTNLTHDNILKYGDLIIKNYFDEATRFAEETDISNYMSNIESFESEWIREEISTEVEEIESALNLNINHLLYRDEEKKIADILHQEENIIDIGRMILQWKFINTFRIKYGIDSNVKLQQAGIDIIYKMHEIVTQHPYFLCSFLGSLSETQLNVLEETFVDDPIIKIFANGSLSDSDLIGNNEKIGFSGQTVLRKSILFFQVSELLKQELLDFLSNEKINEYLFQQHISFVIKRLNEQVKIENSFSHHEFLQQFKNIIQNELAILYANLLNAEKNWPNTEYLQIKCMPLIDIISLRDNVKQNINKLSTEVHMMSFIKSLPMNIVNLLSPNFSTILFQLKYFFANRFKNNIENMLKDNNINEDRIERLKKLKNTNFYHFIKKILNHEDINQLFNVQKNQPTFFLNSLHISQYVPSSLYSFFGSDQTKTHENTRNSEIMMSDNEIVRNII